MLNGMSMLMGNPVGALAGIAGSAVGEDIGAHWGPTGKAVGGLIGGIMSDNLINSHVAFNPNLFKTKLDLLRVGGDNQYLTVDARVRT